MQHTFDFSENVYHSGDMTDFTQIAEKKLSPEFQEHIDPGVYISQKMGPRILPHPHLDLP